MRFLLRPFSHRPLLSVLFLGLGLVSHLIADEDQSRSVLWVPLEGTVELGLAPYIKRAIETAEKEGYSQLILEVETFGGRVDAAVKIRDALLKTDVPTVAWVNNRAISAGALISLATDKIYFATGGSMGAATPIQVGGEGQAQDAGKKFVSYMRGEMAATAEATGRDPKVAEAMVMASESIKDLIEKGEVLTLTDKSAKSTGISEGNADSRAELLKTLGLENAQVTEFEMNWAERIVRFLTEPTVSGLLMSLGVLGLIMEIQSPGLGIPGLISALSFFLFFFGRFFVHLAGFEEVLLLIAGVVLIILEIFILPGLFIFGVLGFVCVVAALFLAGVSPKVPIFFELPEIQDHIYSVSLGFILMFFGAIAIYMLMKRSSGRIPLVFNEAIAAGEGVTPTEQDTRHHLVGQKGIAITDLRPSGKASIGEKIFMVEAEGQFIDRGAEIEVERLDSNRILVRPLRR